MSQQRQRFVADRFRRIWAIVEKIAAEPGMSRRELADKFHLSERQVQADLNIIRSDMRLPLVRRQGYRFASEGAPMGDGAMDLREAQLLVMILRRAMSDRSIPMERLRGLIGKLPAMFPAHLQPLVQRTLLAATSPRPGQEQMVLPALADGLLHGSRVRIHRAPGDASIPFSLGETPTITPDLLLPYLSTWYVIGETDVKPTRTVMLDLAAVAAVTVAAEVER